MMGTIMKEVALPSAGVAVRITLACGWCSRRLDDLPGEMNPATGMMSITPGISLHTLTGRPICPQCGGPLFVDDWTRVRPYVEPDYQEPVDDEAGDPDVSPGALAAA
jgi:hypothetical protein